MVAGYLAGSMPFGYWLVRLAKGVDVRTVGSGNIGATNVWRTFGRRYGAPVVVLDVAKGFAPALVASLLVGDLAAVLTGGAAMIGHTRPLFLKFERGGKAVATAGGVFFAVAPVVAAAALAVWLVTFLLTRYASAASLVAAVAVPTLAVVLDESWPVVALAVGAGAGVIFLHRGNIARLRAGTESRFEIRRRREPVANVGRTP